MTKTVLIVIFILLFSSMPFSQIQDAHSELIPDWVQNIFFWYGQGQISENEVINAIKFLVDQNLIILDTSESMLDVGSFQVVYAPTNDPLYREIRQDLIKSQAFEGLAEILDQTFILPKDITINIAECGVVDAFYQLHTSQIILCYELSEYFALIFPQYAESHDDLTNLIAGATMFVFFHELGHALVDVYDLPITGKEEDAVDQLSAIILLQLGADGRNSLNAASTWLVHEGTQETDVENLLLWDEHSLDLQRFYNITCLVYGENPREHSVLIDSGLLPSSRAEKCQAEYEKIFRSWDLLLSPFVINS